MDRRSFFASIVAAGACCASSADCKDAAPIKITADKEFPQAVVEVTGEEWAVRQFVQVYMDCTNPGWRFDKAQSDIISTGVNESLAKEKLVRIYMATDEAQVACFKAYRSVTKLGAL